MSTPTPRSNWTAELISPRFGGQPAPFAVLALYRAFALLAVVLGAVGLVAAFSHATWLGLLGLVVVLPTVGAALALTRVLCEVVSAILRMADHVGHIRDELPYLRGTVEDLANDMPRLRFLRRSASNREQSSAVEEDPSPSGK